MIVDTKTGETFAFTEAPSEHFEGHVLRVLGWAPDGRMVLGPYRLGDEIHRFSGVLIGPPAGPWEPVELGSTFVYAVSADFLQDGRTVVIHVQVGGRGLPSVFEVDAFTLDLLGASDHPLPPEYSSGGDYAVQPLPNAGGQTKLRIEHLRTNAEEVLEAHEWSWSPTGNRLAYLAWDGSEDGFFTIRLRDFDAGSDIEIGAAAGLFDWSPDGRYLVVEHAWEGQLAFQILDVTGAVGPVTVTNAWGGGWLANGTFYYTSDACGSTSAIHAITPDGTADGALPKSAMEGRFAGYSAVSPDGRRIAYQTSGEDPRLIIKTLDGAEALNIARGNLSLPFATWHIPVWSPDGRYLVLSPLPGKDAPCFVVRDPQPTRIIAP